MGIKVKFIRDENAEDVEVTIRAKAQTEEVNKIIDAIGGKTIACDALSGESEIEKRDIVIISKSGRYLSVKTVTGEFVMKEPLYKIEEKLDGSRFVRISQSEIVNLGYVEGWSFDGGGIIKIELYGGISSYTSRRYAVRIRKILKKRGD